jgi:dipeptidyl aminopeptidase/acylaminoacyl peptidase
MGVRTGEIEVTVERMAKIGACGSPSFSPDETRLAFISNLSGLPQVWTVPVEGGWPEMVTALDDQIHAVRWSPNGEWLAFQLAPGGGMNQQVYVVRPDGTDMRRLTEGGKENNWLGFWTKGTGSLTIASNRRRPEAMDAYLLDIDTGELRLAAENRGIGSFTDVSRDERWAILYQMANRSDNDLYLVRLDDGAETLVTPHEPPGNFGGGCFSPDGRTVYFTSNAGREFGALVAVPIDADGHPGEARILAERDDAEIDGADVTEDGRTAALLWNVGGRSELTFLDLATGAQTPGLVLPTDILGSVQFSRSGRLLALVGTGAAAPRDIWMYDRETQRLRQVTHSPHAGIDLTKLVKPELVHFPAHDGLELSGWLYRPTGACSPGPVVLSFHGGPEGQERPYFNDTYQALLAEGIAVLAPNVRGSSGFGKTFVNLDNGALRFNAVKDIKACVDYVVGAGIAEPGRIGIMGGSYGGYMTMAGLTEYPDLFAAGANLFGIVNFATFFAHTEPWMAAISKIEYGDPDTQADLLRALSPIHKIDRVIAPTIVLHGANDTNVPVVEADQVVDSLKRRGVPVEYVLFPDEGHGFQKIPNRIRAAVSIVQWFARYLRDR